MYIHLPTVIMTTILLNLLLGAAMFVIFNALKSQKSFRTWGIACFVFAIANILAGLRFSLDAPWLTVFVADLLIILVPLLALHGLRQYQLQRSVSNRWTARIMIISAVPLYFLYQSPLQAQVLTASICAALYIYSGAYVQTIKPTPKFTRRALSVLFLVHGVLLLTTAVVVAVESKVSLVISSEQLITVLLIAHLLLTTATTVLFPVFVFSLNERRLLEVVNIDELTQLFNRRGFFELGSELLVKNQAQARPSCVLMLDLDRFKSINDRYGHAAGDACLRDVARIIRKHMREHDIAARIGGEEFAIALADVDRMQAEQVSRRLVERVAQQAFEFEGERIDLTVIVGGIVTTANQRDLSELLNDADSALYEAKSSGRNQFRFV